ncbi:ead/Ea22-like family protein [Escherichia coli]|nr:ead/Ea22-like family protein [Escherichia coli]EFB5889225.1 ead/Ea22-like family protein [Escherichia coli]EKM6606591.1 ead/Ea22-like family protein [Escherichia coli]EKT3579797.1 ead/Ea22-like family protein [Escherichia coli]EKT3736812.1 ead/Ea22-like family protein [Escherichia coli]
MMTINYKVLSEVAAAARGNTTWQNLQAFHAAATPEVVLTLLRALDLCDALDTALDTALGDELNAAPPAWVVPEGLVKAVRFYEQVKRENPPVETGVWKDAVDWVFKEACLAVNTGNKGE